MPRSLLQFINDHVNWETPNMNPQSFYKIKDCGDEFKTMGVKDGDEFWVSHKMTRDEVRDLCTINIIIESGTGNEGTTKFLDRYTDEYWFVSVFHQGICLLPQCMVGEHVEQKDG